MASGIVDLLLLTWNTHPAQVLGMQQRGPQAHQPVAAEAGTAALRKGWWQGRGGKPDVSATLTWCVVTVAGSGDEVRNAEGLPLPGRHCVPPLGPWSGEEEGVMCSRLCLKLELLSDWAEEGRESWPRDSLCSPWVLLDFLEINVSSLDVRP